MGWLPSVKTHRGEKVLLQVSLLSGDAAQDFHLMLKMLVISCCVRTMLGVLSNSLKREKTEVSIADFLGLFAVLVVGECSGSRSFFLVPLDPELQILMAKKGGGGAPLRSPLMYW